MPRTDDTTTGVALIAHRFGVGTPQLVLVHGIGASSRYFGPLADALAPRRAGLVLDLPGFGNNSNPPEPQSVDDHADAVAAALDAEGVTGAVLVGHSMGAQVVAAVADRRPDLVAGVALLGPTVDARARSAARQGGRLLLDMTREPLRSNATVLSDYLFRSGIGYYLRQLPAMLGDRIELRMPALAQPVLVVRGNRDPVAPVEWTAALAASATRGRHAEVPGPHVIMYTAPDEVARLLDDFAGECR
jgi:pimeloyl-ACP methyl ester carboxylesterase